MKKKINDTYFFSSFPLIAGLLFLTVIGFSYLGLTISPKSLENFELSKEELRLPTDMQEIIIAQKKSVARVVGFANFLPAPLNRISFATIPIMSFIWLFLLFRKFGKDGIALSIRDDDLSISTYRGWAHVKRTDIIEIIAESPSEIEFKTALGHQYLSTSTVKDTNAKTLKASLDAWLNGDYKLVEASDGQALKPLETIPDIHPTNS